MILKIRHHPANYLDLTLMIDGGGKLPTRHRGVGNRINLKMDDGWESDILPGKDNTQ